MTQSEADNNVLFLEMQFARTYPKVSRDSLVQDLMNLPSNAGKKAIDELLETEGFLPPPVVVTRKINEIAATYRELEAKKQRMENQSSSTFLNAPHDTEHSGKACKLVKRILAGIDRDQIMAGMKEMHQLRPNAGWDSESIKLKNFWKAKDKKAEDRSAA